MSELEDERAWNRVAAKEEIDNLKAIRATSWEQHSHSFKWLMASLLAINSGACFAIVGNDDIALQNQVFAGFCFLIGIAAALLVATFGQRSIQRSLGPIQNQIGYWTSVARDGDRFDDIEKELADSIRPSVRIGVGGRIAGWVSGIAFFVGAVSAGFGLHTTSQNGQTTPEMIESRVDA